MLTSGCERPSVSSRWRRRRRPEPSGVSNSDLPDSPKWRSAPSDRAYFRCRHAAKLPPKVTRPPLPLPLSISQPDGLSSIDTRRFNYRRFGGLPRFNEARFVSHRLPRPWLRRKILSQDFVSRDAAREPTKSCLLARHSIDQNLIQVMDEGVSWNHTIEHTNPDRSFYKLMCNSLVKIFYTQIIVVIVAYCC